MVYMDDFLDLTYYCHYFILLAGSFLGVEPLDLAVSINIRGFCALLEYLHGNTFTLSV